MKKDIIIIGNEQSGKSFVAKLLAKGYTHIMHDGRMHSTVNGLGLQQLFEGYYRANIKYVIIDEAFYSDIILVDDLKSTIESQISDVEAPTFIYVLNSIIEASIHPVILDKHHILNPELLTIAQLLDFCKNNDIIIN